MTAATFAQLPMQFGGTLLHSASRIAMMLAARYMRAPLANTGIAALVAMSALAASNAMYLQPHAHPAPLFGAESPAAEAGSTVQPVVPLMRPSDLKFSKLPSVPVAEKPVSAPVDAADDDTPVGNKDVFEVQRKLEMLRLFTGTIDGYYGPQTARAIRKFQELVGLKPTGELTRDLVDQVRNAPMTLGDARTQAVPAPASMPVIEVPAVAPMAIAPAVQAAPVEEMPAEAPASQPLGVLPNIEADTGADAVTGAVDPQTLAQLPTPEPLVADIQTGSIKTMSQPVEAQPTLLGRPVPTTANGALQMAADTAGEAIDTIISGVQALAASQPVQPKPAAFVPEKLAETAKAETPAAAPVAASPGLAVASAEPDWPAKLPAAATSATDPTFVAKVQRGLASLGFLHGPADGVAGEATAKAIRNFEVYFNYQVTGSVSPGLLDLLVQNGASI